MGGILIPTPQVLLTAVELAVLPVLRAQGGLVALVQMQELPMLQAQAAAAEAEALLRQESAAPGVFHRAVGVEAELARLAAPEAKVGTAES